MENYIIIKVTEPDSEGSTEAAMLRRRIHSLAQELGIDIADNLIRKNQETFIWGAKVPYAEAEELFRKVMYKKGSDG